MFQTCMFCKYATWNRKYSPFTFSGQVSDPILHRSRGPTRTKQTQFAIRGKRLIYPNLPPKKKINLQNICIVGKVFRARYRFLELSAFAGYLRHLIKVLGCYQVFVLSNGCTIKYSKKDVKIYIKINIKSAATCFGFFLEYLIVHPLDKIKNW